MAFRVVTFRLPQLVRAAVILMGVLIAILLAVTLFSGKSSSPPDAALYRPGLYTASVSFGTQTVSVEVIMNGAGIQSVSYLIPEDVTSVYPLIMTTCNMIEQQVAAGGDPNAIQPDTNAMDTASYLLRAITAAKNKALK